MLTGDSREENTLFKCPNTLWWLEKKGDKAKKFLNTDNFLLSATSPIILHNNATIYLNA